MPGIVRWSAADASGVDYEAAPASPLAFKLNVPSQTVEISPLPRAGVQGPRAFRVILHGLAGGPGAAPGSPAEVVVPILDAP